MRVNIKKLDKNAITPKYSKVGDAGLDITAISKYYDEYGNAVFGTGLSIEIPSGFVGLLFPRSSISKNSEILTNCVGVIDSSYRGEIMFKFKNLPAGHSFSTKEKQKYEVGDRVGQLIIIPYPQIEIFEVEELSSTERGTNGFGSSGR